MIATDSRRAWLEERQTGIGGSDVAAILGVDPFGKTAAQLFDEKTGPVVDDEPTGPMKRGTRLEPIAIEEYVAETGRVVVPRTQQRHKDYPWMIGNVDSEQEPVDGHEGPGPLEVKCPGLKAFYYYINHGLHDGYILQLQHYLEVLDREWGTFAIFNAEPWKVHYFDVERDRELMAEVLDAEQKFWEMKENGIRPEGPVATVDVKAVKGVVITRDDPEWAAAWNEYWEAKELAATSKQLIASARSVIEELCGEYGSFEGSGTRLHWKLQDGRKTFDHKRLAAVRPLDRGKVISMLADDLGAESAAQIDFDAMTLKLDQFFKQGAPSPSFRPYPLKARTEDV